MEILPINDMLEFQPNTLEEVRRIYDLDKPGAMKDAVDILDQWIRMQNHFTKKDFSKDYLERTIIENKGSVERAKARLDKLFTLRTLMPKYFQEYDARYDFDIIQDILTYVMLPKMTKDYDRVMLCRCTGKKFSSKIYLQGYRFSLLLSEYLRAHDYAKSHYIIIDYLTVGMTELLTAFDPMDMRQAIIAHIEGYGVRVKGVHILVNSKFVDIVISLAKQVVSEKIGKRIHTHKSYEELFEHVPKEIFPKEFGGEEKSLKELHAEWMKTFSTEEFREYWKMQNSARTDEAYRQTDKFKDQYMGMPGTFRSLSVD